MKSIVTTLILFSNLFLMSQGYNIDIKVNNYDNDTLIVGYYYGDRQLVKDTLFAASKGTFKFQGEEKLDGGMYLLLFKPENSIFQFLMPEEDQEFSIQCDTKDIGAVVVEGDDDNKTFFAYMDFLKEMRKEADPLRVLVDSLKKEDLPTAEYQAKIDALDEKVKRRRNEIVESKPNTVTAQLLRSNIEVDVPAFEGDKAEDIAMMKYKYYKQHYFDNINFSYPSLVRTPYYHNRIHTYLDKLVVNHPDSIKKEIDYIISLVKDNEDAYRYTLSSILNKYAKNKFIGMDAIYVHMIDTYYSQGTADWVDEENLLKMQENANNLRPILIGKVFPNITVYKEDLTPVRINNVKSDYTMVIFWAPDCGHCKKSMPKIVDFYEKYKDKGLKVVSVCTKGGEKLANCWEYIEEKGMEGFINTGDKYQKYRRYVYVPSTPKIFLLDDNKEILIKDMPADELPNIMDKILEEKAAE